MLIIFFTIWALGFMVKLQNNKCEARHEKWFYCWGNRITTFAFACETVYCFQNEHYIIGGLLSLLFILGVREDIKMTPIARQAFAEELQRVKDEDF